MQNNISLSAIETFSVVAQNLNLSRAAEVLHITPSAVSHRMKRLEEQMGTILFERLPQGVKLTAAGEALQQHTTIAMKNIQHGIQQSQFHASGRKLRIAVIPSLGQHWLIPRLNHFFSECPHVDLEVIALNQIADFRLDQIDGHIHFGSGEYRNLEATFLCGETVFPVCHPSLLNTDDNIIKHIESYGLLHYNAGVEDAPGGIGWSDWLTHFDLAQPKAMRQSWYNQVDMTMNAAQHKQGITLCWQKISSHALATKQLVRIGDQELQTDYSYYLVSPRGRSKNPDFDLFSVWLQQQMAQQL